MVTPNFLYRADEKGFDKAIVIYDLMHIASGYDLIQKEALMITLGTSEEKRERFCRSEDQQLERMMTLSHCKRS